MRKTLLFSCLVLTSLELHAQPAPQSLPKIAPNVDQILSLKRVGSPEISPDGRWIAYTVRDANWDDNAYETEIWLVDASGVNGSNPSPRQLTNAKKSSLSPSWSPDGSKLAFISDRTDKRQIYVINPQAGEADAVTTLEDGIDSFAWSPDGKSLAYTATEPKSDARQGTGEEIRRAADRRAGLSDVAPLPRRSRDKTTRSLTSGPFTVGSFAWSPDGSSIAFDHRVNTATASSGSADVSIVTVADAQCGLS